MTFVSELHPTRLWRHFDEILTIPRGSKEEDRIRDRVLAVAERVGCAHEVDATGNVIVRKAASPGRDDAPTVVLQAHLDMVQEKNSDVDFDFGTDAIRPVLEEAYLTADGTTLGADNGIGVAAMLAVLEADDVAHGPLELLFTVDEETGLTGAQGLEAHRLRGRRLINLDSEEEGTLTVGCAGGADTRLALPLESVPAPPSCTAHSVSLRGLQGGHSGIDIHLQRGNAVQLLARIVRAAGLPGHLAGLEGGDKHNAIPREARATIVLPEGPTGSPLERVRARFDEVRAEFAGPEPAMRLEVQETSAPATVWSVATGERVLDLLVALPHGVAAMSSDISGLVETSCNLAAAKSGPGRLEILMSSRSSVASGMAWIRAKIEAVAELAGATLHHRDGYPGWRPKMDSQMLAVVRGVHERVLGVEPRVEAVHAGLECGLIGEMVPGMDMISFGPQIEFPHSPSERVEVASVERFYRLLVATLEELAR